jgi:hypothetical protein
MFMQPNQPTLMDVPRKRRNLEFNPKEYKVQTMRECVTPAEMQLCDTPDKAAAYWRAHVSTHPYFSPDVECFVVLLVNTRRKIQGHVLISTGTLDTILVHPREVFRPACIAASAAVVLMHNLCAATHKLCYVTHRVMCSWRVAAVTPTGALR